MAVAGKQIDGFVFRHQITHLLPWDFNHTLAVVHFEMSETVCFFAVFFDDAVKRGLQAGHFDRFEQIVCGSQFKRAQGVFFVGCGEYNFRLAFGGTLNAFDKFETVDFRHTDVGKDDVDFVDAQPLQCWHGVVKDVEQYDIALFQ